MAPVTVFLFSHWFAGVFVAIQATESKQLNPPINLWFSKFLFKITSLEHWIKIKWQLKCQRNSANCRKTNFLKYSWNSQENSKVRAYWFTSKKYSVAVALLIEKLFCSISVALFLNTFLKKKEKWLWKNMLRPICTGSYPPPGYRILLVQTTFIWTKQYTYSERQLLVNLSLDGYATVNHL